MKTTKSKYLCHSCGKEDNASHDHNVRKTENMTGCDIICRHCGQIIFNGCVEDCAFCLDAFSK